MSHKEGTEVEASHGAEEALLVGAAVYARVSSTGQLGRDGDEDGYSIPAQVKAGEQKAAELGAKVEKAYIERAESAKSDDRPVLQMMLRELPALKVKYLIVHKVDRLARNRLDDAQLYERLVKMGITLVSVTENIDETPAGRLMHGMLASFAEYYSNNLAHEIRKGLRQKHENGGTPHKPPIGYMSKRELIGNQDIRSVVVDPDRADLVRLAFQLYATGNWTLHSLADHLEEQGLRSRGTRRYPERPLPYNRIHAMLHNPYYVGTVVWSGRRFAGRHPKLVDQDTFDRVQMLLAANKVGGDRCQVHHHYLRGTIVCEKCLGRLLFGRHRGRSGQQYDYFSCNNRSVRRKDTRCDSGHYAVSAVEQKIEELYRSVRLTAAVKEQIRTELRQELSDRAALIQLEAERHDRALKAIEKKQEKLVQLFYKDLVTETVFEAEQDKLKGERHAAERLRSSATAQLEDVQAALELALSRIDGADEIYRDGTPMERRLMNQAIFIRIEVGEDGQILRTGLTPVYEALGAWVPGLGRPAQEAGGQCSPFVRLPSGPVHGDPNATWPRGMGSGPACGERPCRVLGCPSESGTSQARARGAYGRVPGRSVQSFARAGRPAQCTAICYLHDGPTRHSSARRRRGRDR
jgi:site-specific DNA recombinase